MYRILINLVWKAGLLALAGLCVLAAARLAAQDSPSAVVVGLGLGGLFGTAALLTELEGRSGGPRG